MGSALADYAMPVARSRGRRYPEPPHPYRNDYARDRDRILHSRAFRRLEQKTQVFTIRYSDHFRNRLTHTLEVAQIARTVARALQLNEDLTEALALAHDLGHPPFGHAGERRLDEILQRFGERFEHNRHALRIVEYFEQRYLDFPGLNLTFEVREGIVKHSRDYTPQEAPELAEYCLGLRPPLEAQLIDRVDEIAYNVADTDDAFEARLLECEAVVEGVELFGHCYRALPESAKAWWRLKTDEALRRALDLMVTDLIDATRQAIQTSGVRSVEEVRHYPVRLVGFSPERAAQVEQWKQFLRVHLYEHPLIVEDRTRLVAGLDRLFQFYLDHPDRLPPYFAERARREPVHRVICDYIAGMTDSYLLRLHQELIGQPVLSGSN